MATTLTGTIWGGGVMFSASPAILRPKPQGQVFIAKGSAPWCGNTGYFFVWPDKDKIVSTDESISGQATVTCKGVTSMENMFFDCEKLTSIDLSNFDTSNVTNMTCMFDGCISITSLDLSVFDTSKVIDMSYMFYDCTGLTTLDISNFDTSNVNNMQSMFGKCSSLTTIKGVIDMKSCTNAGTIKDSYGYDTRMFANCPKLSGVKIKNPPAGFDGAGLSSSQYTIVS